jgi:molecular chaperone HscB
MARDHYQVLGLPRRYHLDAGELEQRYLALQKETHPDRFAKAMPRERLEAVVRNTELNDAYKILKQPIRRAEYLLKLEGIDIGDERPQAATGQTKQLVVDPQLLIEIMELRELLAEAHEEQDVRRVEALAADVGRRQQAATAVVESGFAAYEAGDKSQLDAIARALVSLRYYARFMDEAQGKD